MRVEKSVVADDHATRREWTAVPPLQRVVQPIAPVAPREPFVAALRSHHNPSFLAPLTHAVDPAGPGGLITGLLTPLRTQNLRRDVADGADLSFVQRLRARVRPVSRMAESAPVNEESRSAPSDDPPPANPVAEPDDDRRVPETTTADEADAQTRGPHPSPVRAETIAPAPTVRSSAVREPTPQPTPVQRTVTEVAPPLTPLAGARLGVTLEQAITASPENRPAPAGTGATDGRSGTWSFPADVPVQRASRDRPVEPQRPAHAQRLPDSPAIDDPVPTAHTQPPHTSGVDPTPVARAAPARSLPPNGTLTTAPPQPAVSLALPVVARATDIGPISEAPIDPARVDPARVDPARGEPEPAGAAPVSDHPILSVSDHEPVLIGPPAQQPSASVPDDGGDSARRSHRATAPASTVAATSTVQRVTIDERPPSRPAEPLRAVPTDPPVPSPRAPVDAEQLGPSASVIVEAWAAARQSGLPVSRSVDRTTRAPVVQRQSASPLPGDAAGVSTPAPATSPSGPWATAPVITHAEPLRVPPVREASGSVSVPGATAGQPSAPDRPVQVQAPLVLRPVAQRATEPTALGPAAGVEPAAARPAPAVRSTWVGTPQRESVGQSMAPPALPLRASGPTAADAGVAQRSVGGSVIIPAPSDEPSEETIPGVAQVATAVAEPQVQRQDAAQPQDSGAAQSAPSTTSASPTAAAPTQNLDDLVRRLYDPLAARLRAELRLDRERAGLITDLRRP